MRVTLNEATHVYTNDYGQVYTGCSTLVGICKNPFNTQERATAYALKHGQTPEYWIEQWKIKKDMACEIGHEFHKNKEEYSENQVIELRFKKPYKVRNQYLIHTDDLFEYPDGLYNEMDLWHHGYQIAGRADKVFIETIGGIRYVDIDDYKTNEQIEMLSYKYKNGSYKMMLRPLGHLMDCNYIHYELQQSIYAFMLESYGFTIRSMRLLHHGHTDGGAGRKEEGREIDLHYRKRDVLTLLEFNRKLKRA